MTNDGDHIAPDPRSRPADPAGTQPKHDPDSLLPSDPEPLLAEPEVVEADVVEEEEEATEPSLLPARRAAAGAPALATPGHTQWTPRFQFLLGALVAIGLAAIAAIVALVAIPGDTKQAEARWSSWAPTADNGLGAQQIAEHVGQKYRLNDGRQLVLVSVGPLELGGIPLAVAVRETPNEGGGIQFFEDEGLIYRFCGLGPDCAIASGKPSTERHLLLRREALELAVYSFHYLGVKSVVVFMPPPPGQKPTQALFFRRSDVASVLRQPLTASLSPRPPSVRTVKLSPDAGLVNDLTTSKIFTFSLTQANTDNKGYIVLDRFDPTQVQPDPSSGSSSTAESDAPSQSASGGTNATVASAG